MRKLSFTGLLCAMLAGCTTPAASQQMADMPVCRMVTGTADIDGTPQQISGLACQQPDGSWQIMQGDNETLVYPNTVDYYDAPWYGVWPPFFVGASVVFVDRFHHFHHMDHVHAGAPDMRIGMPAGFHGGIHNGFHGGFGGVRTGAVWSGMGAMGGGHRR